MRIAATDGASRAVILDRLLASLNANAWSITVANGPGGGRRPVPGRIEYTDHRLSFGVDRNLDWAGDNVPSDQVVIFVGDLD